MAGNNILSQDEIPEKIICTATAVTTNPVIRIRGPVMCSFSITFPMGCDDNIRIKLVVIAAIKQPMVR